MPIASRPAGTIPARAGETRAYCCSHAAPRDHPRSRGGNRQCLLRFVAGVGPSPLARGKLLVFCNDIRSIGTIPARAGETPAPLPARACTRDHPRSRGGNPLPGNAPKRAVGPSPLARGKRNELTHEHQPARTIPARAGETPLLCITELRHRDHPRSRGGNVPPERAIAVIEGPSPLARGKL